MSLIFHNYIYKVIWAFRIFVIDRVFLIRLKILIRLLSFDFRYLILYVGTEIRKRVYLSLPITSKKNIFVQ